MPDSDGGFAILLQALSLSVFLRARDNSRRRLGVCIPAAMQINPTAHCREKALHLTVCLSDWVFLPSPYHHFRLFGANRIGRPARNGRFRGPIRGGRRRTDGGDPGAR
jgi:hypothetical protein